MNKPALLEDVWEPTTSCANYRTPTGQTGVFLTKMHTSNQMKLIMRDFLDRDVVTMEHLLDSVYPIDSDRELPEDMNDVIRVRMSSIRKILKSGWYIETLGHYRWSLQREVPPS